MTTLKQLKEYIEETSLEEGILGKKEYDHIARSAQHLPKHDQEFLAYRLSGTNPHYQPERFLKATSENQFSRPSRSQPKFTREHLKMLSHISKGMSDEEGAAKFRSNLGINESLEESISPSSSANVIKLAGAEPGDSYFQHNDDVRNKVVSYGKRNGIKHNSSSRASGKSLDRHVWDRLHSIALKHRVDDQ